MLKTSILQNHDIQPALASAPPTPSTQIQDPDPLELGTDGQPLTWTEPRGITVSFATQNYAGDGSPFFTHSLPLDYQSLFIAAEDVWESVANVHFMNVPDATGSADAADIRVGLSTLTQYLSKPGSATFIIGNTSYRWNTDTDKFIPDTRISIEDPTEDGDAKLSDGNYQYNSFTATVFQDMIHELGHALGLDHNQTDKSAIMNPLLSSSNPYPDSNDIAALRSLYGAPTSAPSFSPTQVTLLTDLGVSFS